MNKTIEEYKDILSSIKETQRKLEELMVLKMIVKLLILSSYGIMSEEDKE